MWRPSCKTNWAQWYIRLELRLLTKLGSYLLLAVAIRSCAPVPGDCGVRIENGCTRMGPDLIDLDRCAVQWSGLQWPRSSRVVSDRLADEGITSNID